jgi:hypothetical protein
VAPKPAPKTSPCCISSRLEVAAHGRVGLRPDLLMETLSFKE